MNEPKAQTIKSSAFKLGWIGIIIAIIALAIGAVALLAGFNHLHTLSQRQHVDKSNLANLTREVAKLSRQSATQSALIAEQQRHLQNVVVKNYQNDYAWVLSEANYLVRQAQFILIFDHNPDLAEQLLVAADRRIASLNNPTLMPVRQALADHIQALKAVPRVHMDSIILNINALGQQIASLPIVSDKQTKAPTKTKANKKPVSGWRHSLEASWQQLRQVIVVQYHPQMVNQLILPVNRSYLDIHLQMLLGQASWAALHQQTEVYQQSLQAATSWIHNYYIVDAPATVSFLNTLQQLSQINISPPMPDLNAAIEAIHSAKVILITPANTAVEKP